MGSIPTAGSSEKVFHPGRKLQRFFPSEPVCFLQGFHRSDILHEPLAREIGQPLPMLQLEIHDVYYLYLFIDGLVKRKLAWALTGHSDCDNLVHPQPGKTTELEWFLGRRRTRPLNVRFVIAANNVCESAELPSTRITSRPVPPPPLKKLQNIPQVLSNRSVQY